MKHFYLEHELLFKHYQGEIFTITDTRPDARENTYTIDFKYKFVEETPDGYKYVYDRNLK